jgi:arylformamidase
MELAFIIIVNIPISCYLLYTKNGALKMRAYVKKIIDITIEISGKMLVWEGDPGANIRQVLAMKNGAPYNLTRLNLGVHNGSHVDAPLHFLEDGKSIDQFPLSVMVGPAQVVEIDDHIDLITADVLKTAGIHPETKRLLFKTRNSNYWKKQITIFQKDYCGVTTDGAQFLANLSLQLVGIDYLSISPLSDLEEPHRILMRKDVVILETVNLAGVNPGFYDLYCLPLKLIGCEGAPARVILVS